MCLPTLTNGYSLQALCHTEMNMPCRKAVIVLRLRDACRGPLVVVMQRSVNCLYTSFDGGGNAGDRPRRFFRNLCRRELLLPAVKLLDSV
jgi:hypothetical protein